MLSTVAPIVIQTENYDQGGQNVAYYDLDTANRGKAYRTSEGVDIETCSDTGGGYDVGWARASEWINYTVNVPATGTYKLDFRVASRGTGGTFHVNVDGVNQTGTVRVPNTGDWSIWQTISSPTFNLTAGQHVFRIVMDTNGTSGNVGDLNWFRIVNVPPAAPSSLTASATSASTVALSWVDNASNETGYQVERKTGASGAYQVIATVAANTAKYSDSGLSGSTQYYYRVTALQNTISSAYSNEASATTLADATTYTPTWKNTAFAAQSGQFTAEFDATPAMANMDMVMGLSNGSATAFTSLAAIVRFNSTGAIDARNGDSYVADASASYTAGSKYHVKFVVNLATHTYDAYVTSGTTTTQIAKAYAFRTEQAGVTQLNQLTSYNESGDATLSTPVVVAVALAPAAPSGLTATASSASAIALSWTDNATNESGSYIERSVDGTSFTQIASVGAGVSSYSDSGLSAASRYYYRVRAFNAAGTSAYSVVASATTQADTATYTPTWKNTAFAAQSGQFTAEFDATPATANMDMVMGLSNGSTTSYAALAATVRFNSTGTIDVRNGDSYAAAAAVNYTAGSKYHFKLVVDMNTDAYDVYVTSGTTTTKLASGYAFRTEQAGVTQLSAMASYNEAGDAALSAPVVAAVVVTAPAAPTGLTATASSSSAVSLNWTDNASNETGYQVERKTGSGGTYQVIATLAAGSKSYSDSGLGASTQYFYRVTALQSTIKSAYSNEASATTLAATTPTSTVLIPGSGFTSSTPQPAQIGSGFAATEKPMARWEAVPYQAFSGTLNVGVVAFHINGIDRVEFSVNGGSWQAVRQMTLNPETGVVEYWTTLDASKFASDQPAEVRAVVYPVAGVPRVLGGTFAAGSGIYGNNGENSLMLYANARGTMPQVSMYVSTTGSDTSGNGTEANPFATIYRAATAITASNGGKADNAVIYLKAGDYSYAGASGSTWSASATSNSWLTITHAPGVARSSVRITGSSATDALNASKVHIKDLTVQTGLTTMVSNAGIWLDNCLVTSTGISSNIYAAYMYQWNGGVWVTDSEFTKLANAVNGALLVRGTSVHDIGEDAFRDVYLLVNSTAANIQQGTSTMHPDVVQYSGESNAIIYGLRATTNIGAQGISSNGPQNDVAFVNVVMTTQMINLQMEYAHRNLYILNGTFGGYCFWRTDEAAPKTFSAIDVVVENSGTAFSGTLVSGVTYR